MARVSESFQSSLHLVQVLLAKIEGVSLAPIAERNRISCTDIPIFKVASNDDLRDTGH
jgi:hypothetical protein